MSEMLSEVQTPPGAPVVVPTHAIGRLCGPGSEGTWVPEPVVLGRRRRGRPRVEEPRTEGRTVYFSPSEIAVLRERATAAGISFNRYVRTAALIEPPRAKPSRVRREAILALDAVGGLFNQLVGLAHRLQRLPEAAQYAVDRDRVMAAVDALAVDP